MNERIRTLSKSVPELFAIRVTNGVNPAYDDALGNKGLALDNLCKYQEAIDCYYKALKVDQNYGRLIISTSVLIFL